MPGKPRNKKKFNYSLTILLLIFILGSIGYAYYKNSIIPRINEAKFEEIVKKGKVKKILLKKNEGQVHIFLRQEKKDLGYLPMKNSMPDYILLIPNSLVFDNHYQEIKKKTPEKYRIDYTIEEYSPSVISFLYRLFMIFYYLMLISFILMFVFGYFGGSVGDLGGGGGVFGLGKSRAKCWNKEQNIGVMFKDVIGMKEAKEEVMEVVDFFKKKGKFDTMGAKSPKGVLLVGPPGTGKTLLARAVAGETKANFMYTSGPDFIDMFVGVGAMRMQSLFEEARKLQPCIIFIDEIDAIGRKRSRNAMAGSQDGDNTQNQFLAEMDGFTKNNQIVVIGATNRVNVLDPAFLRPGRFDRKISIDLPRMEDREAIFSYYIKKMPKVAKNIIIHRLAELTPWISPASIANICNEAAIRAVRSDKEQVDMVDFEKSIDREIGGIEKPSMRISKLEKEIVAYHEVGHALVSWFLEDAEELVKITIIPRGEGSLGFAQYQPEEKVIYQEKEFLAELAAFLGGRAAEWIVYNQFSTGASNDLVRATNMARRNVELYGMSQILGHAAYQEEDSYQMTKPYSEKVAALIDEEVKRLLDSAYETALNILKDKEEILHKVKKVLMKKEVLYKKDLVKLVGARKFKKKEKFLEKNPL